MKNHSGQVTQKRTLQRDKCPETVKSSIFYNSCKLQGALKKHNSFTLQCAMAQVVSFRPLTAEAWVQSRVSPCDTYGGHSGTKISFSPSTSVFPC